MGAEERARQRIGQSVTESIGADLEKTGRRLTLTQQAVNRQAQALELTAQTMEALYGDYAKLRDRIDELELSRWAKTKRYVFGVVARARQDYQLSRLAEAGYVTPITGLEEPGEVIADGEEQGQGEEQGEVREGLLTTQPDVPAVDASGESEPPAESFAQMRERYRGPRGTLH